MSLRYVVEKGSVTIDGVSLTVAELRPDGFVVSLIPETLERTTLGAVVPGSRVNIEVDVLAKYVERLVREMIDAETKSPFGTIEQALEDIRHGQDGHRLDAEDRENEGDLVLAASSRPRRRSTSWRPTPVA